MTRKEAEANRTINSLLSAASHLSAAMSDLKEAGRSDAASVLATSREARVAEARDIAVRVSPSFWDAWRETFEDLEQD